mgnify:CR=1 FL=1|nr:MAG TPA: hypothetical protein [Caudoviricetes sp.]
MKSYEDIKNFMYDMNNTKKCDSCPCNIGEPLPGTVLPCGQWLCWISLNSGNMEMCDAEEEEFCEEDWESLEKYTVYI